MLAKFMRPLCVCHNDHRIPGDLEEVNRVFNLMESLAPTRKELMESHPRKPVPDIVFWNRKLQVARAESIQKLKADLCRKTKPVTRIIQRCIFVFGSR